MPAWNKHHHGNVVALNGNFKVPHPTDLLPKRGQVRVTVFSSGNVAFHGTVMHIVAVVRAVTLLQSQARYDGFFLGKILLTQPNNKMKRIN